MKKSTAILLTAIALFLTPNLHNHSLSYLYFIVALGLLLSIVLVKQFYAFHSVIKIPTNSYTLFFLCFVAWSFLSILWSPVPSDSFYSALIFLVLPLGLLISFWSTSKQQQYFHLTLAAYIVIIMIKAYYQRFIDPSHLLAPGFFLNKNTNAIFIAMLLLPFCTCFLTEKTTYKKHIIGFVIACGTFIIALTVSRGALLGLGIGIIILLTHVLLEKQAIKNFLKLTSYLFSGFVLAEFLTGASYLNRAVNLSSSNNLTTISAGRDYIWNSGLQMYLEQPFLGRGFNMFHSLFPQFRHLNAPDIGQFAHNDYLQFLIELGPIGLLFFIGFIITFLKSSYTLYSKTADHNQKLQTLGLITACIAVFTHSFFTFNFYQPAPLLLMGLYMGIITQRLDHLKIQLSLSFIPCKIIFFTKTGYIGILTAMSVVILYFISINSFTLYKVFSTYPNNLIALENTIQASSLTPFKEEYFATEANIYTLLLSKDAHMFNSEGKHQLIELGKKAVDKAIIGNPFRDLNYSNKAKLYLFDSTEQENHSQTIINSFSEAIRLDPFNLQSRLDLADALMHFNKKQDALNALTGGLERRYFSNYQNGILYLQILLALVIPTNDSEAIENIKQQIDQLLDKKGTGGYFTLQSFDQHQK
ncbi:MAG: hypothetical protein GQ532_05050 [Methylomarinum sp.]|nr:hypothetical protein [Methylomarinum sp.]